MVCRHGYLCGSSTLQSLYDGLGRLTLSVSCPLFIHASANASQAVVGGYSAFGLSGVVVGPVLLCTLRAVYETYTSSTASKTEETPVVPVHGHGLQLGPPPGVPHLIRSQSGVDPVVINKILHLQQQRHQ